MNAVDLTLLNDTLLSALREDIGSGDITTRATIPAEARATGRYTSKQALVVAGLDVTHEIARLVDPELSFKTVARDGVSIPAGSTLAEVHGRASSIVTGERTSLNLLQRMCGIATLTREY